jgi:hypothetical protein
MAFAMHQQMKLRAGYVGRDRMVSMGKYVMSPQRPFALINARAMGSASLDTASAIPGGLGWIVPPGLKGITRTAPWVSFYLHIIFKAVDSVFLTSVNPARM